MAAQAPGLPLGVIALAIDPPTQAYLSVKPDEFPKKRALLRMKWIPKAKLEVDLNAKDPNSNFMVAAQAIREYAGDELLLMYDKMEKYGQYYLLCVRPEAAEAQLKAQLEQEAGEKEEGLMVARAWSCMGSDAEVVEEAGVINTRDPIRFNYARKRMFFGNTVAARFQDKDSQEHDHGKQVDSKSTRDTIELRRREIDVGVQACAPKVDAGIQAGGFLNVGLQYTARLMPAAEADEIAASDKFVDFIHEILPKAQAVVEQIESYDVFQDEVTSLAVESDSSTIQKTADIPKEMQFFQSSLFTKKAHISCMDWQPGSKDGLVAVGYMPNIPVEERLLVVGKAKTTAILLWKYTDHFQPMNELECPSDVFCFKFNPNHNNYAVAGCYNGQIVLFDLAGVVASSQDKAKSDEEAGGATKKQVVKLKPLAHSSVEDGQTTSVADICWLADGQEITKDFVLRQSRDGRTYQFVACGADGLICFWDVRDINKAGGWVPFYKLTLRRPASPHHLPLFRMALSNLTDGGSFLAATEDGEIVGVNWVPAEETTGNRNHAVKWLTAKAQFGPIVSLERSLDGACFLTVGDSSFNIWKEGLEKAVFTSWQSPRRYTCGQFSPKRPAVVFIGCMDGQLEIWDLAERTHEPATVFAATSGPAITALSFFSFAGQHMLALGDMLGILHIIEIPRIFKTMQPGEETTVSELFERHFRMSNYLKMRKRTRKEEEVDAKLKSRRGPAAQLDFVYDDDEEEAIAEQSETASLAGSVVHSVGAGT